MAVVIERADQLILNYVSKAADAAHGVLSADQRLDFAKRLRARIEHERRGSQNAREVVRVLERFGDPAALVAREAHRLAERDRAPDGTAVLPRVDGTPGAAHFPTIRDDAELPRSAAQHVRLARDRLSRRPGRGMPLAGLRRAVMSSANPMTTEGRDAVTIAREHPRETVAMALLLVAALMVPFNLPAVAIFRVPVIIWAIGAVIVLVSDSWTLRDRLMGIGAPIVGYGLGGVVVGGLRVGSEAGFDRFFTEFFNVSGIMFMIGAGIGVVLLAYRLFNVS
ncbi:hypothetical protein [Nonomuraea typhae]|uniref:hypothetical protein n=1 Tax=Nonomuraea typhae TaxID=2603600 RepID=UPI0012F833E7|nr:hypothetical protein [Nonomuraea typhae]